VKKFFRRPQRIFIFPNRYGFAGFALFLIAIAAGATYQNNLVFMLAFFSLALSLIAILQTARNLRNLEVLSLYVEPEFAGHTTFALFNLTNQSADPKINIEIEAEYRSDHDPKIKTTIPFSILSLDALSTTLTKAQFQMPNRRGLYRLHRLRIRTTAPYGLFRAWIYADLKNEFIVFPKRMGSKTLPHAPTSIGEDFSGHKSYTPGDSLNRIDWKVFSRRREYMVKQFQDDGRKQIHFHFKPLNPQNIENELSQFSLWIHEAHQNQFDFRLDTDFFESPFGHDKRHMQLCLKELALWKA
jgi:uncharacterized protein (DUF58 family)